jgi:tetratricopeptide (TPR) repeat protein
MPVRLRSVAPLVASLGALVLACSGEPAAPVVEAKKTPPRPTSIPITTSSEQAHELFVEARKLSDRIRTTEARELYLRAIAEDRYFALAHLAVANNSVSMREFFESMERAVALSDVVSDGERLMILAQDAGVRGDQTEQGELLQRLVEIHPEDARAHLLLGDYHNARQEFDRAIARYEAAVALDPDFSPAYNNLGYLYRNIGRYEDAERAFLRYVELIPDEPNPRDSYAELLMKIGRFEDSIAAYEEALAIKPDFLFSLLGIGYDQIFLGRYDEARRTFARQRELASDIGQRRAAMTGTAHSYLHEGDPERALEVIEEMLTLARTDGDPASMAGDLMTMGAILVATNRPDRAEEKFVEAVRLMGEASVPEDVKDNVRRNFLYWKSRIELARGRIDDAESHLAAYQARVAERELPSEERMTHELAGDIALARGDAARALEELSAASQQNPRVLFLTAEAHALAGDLPKAREQARRAAEFNAFGLGYALVRRPALELLDRLG